jgi:erythromycin esterase
VTFVQHFFDSIGQQRTFGGSSANLLAIQYRFGMLSWGLETRTMKPALGTASNETCNGHPDKCVVDWIRSRAISLSTVEPQCGFKDLEAFRAIIGDAQIVSLGEATHGTREFFKLKHRLLEFCVAKLGFTMLVMEASFPESLTVNAYVLNGLGNAADALAGMRFWTWDTEEVLDLIEWMRWWNTNNARKVKFYGYAMAYPAGAAHGLIEFLVRVSPELAVTCKTELAPLSSDFTAALFMQLSNARRDRTYACIAKVLAAFEGQRPNWIAATSVIDWHLGRLHAIVLNQGARFAVERSAAFHERAVAENICALVEAEGPHAKAVLWSHNTHAARARHSDSQSMGKWLDDMVGRRQIVVGFSFDRGTFQARAYPRGELADHSVAAATPDSLDGVLAQAGLPLFALDLANARCEGCVGRWLASEMPMRSIGGIYGLPKDNEYGVSYSEMVTPRAYFDAVVFVGETTAARRNRPSAPRPSAPVVCVPSNLELTGEGIPVGWQTGTDGYHRHAIGVCEEVSPGGGRTVRMWRDAPWRWGEGQLVQRISARASRGHLLRFSATFRTMARDVGSGALLFLRFLPKPVGDESDFFVTPLVTATSTAEPVQSPQWATLAVEAKVPEAAESFMIGLAMTGNGTAWFGALQFAAIPSSQ